MPRLTKNEIGTDRNLLRIERFSSIKSQIISAFCHEFDCDVLCLQETHRGQTQAKPAIPNYTPVCEIPHQKQGTVIFLKRNAPFESFAKVRTVDTEQVSVKLSNISINNIYQTLNSASAMAKKSNTSEPTISIYIGDTNSHNPQRGYADEDEKGKELVFFIEQHNLALIHDAELSFTFQRSRWRKGYSPDLILVDDRINELCAKVVLPPVPDSQHRPILLRVNSVAKARDTPFRRRYDFRKSNWDSFSKDLESYLTFGPVVENSENFIECVRRASNRNVPEDAERKTSRDSMIDDSAKDLNAIESATWTRFLKRQSSSATNYCNR